MLETLQKRGVEFEQAFLIELRAKGKRIVEIDPESSRAYEDTIEAMKSGADYIYQARMELDNWQGRAEFTMFYKDFLTDFQAIKQTCKKR